MITSPHATQLSTTQSPTQDLLPTTDEDEGQTKDRQTTNNVRLTPETLIFPSVLLDSAHMHPQNQTANSVRQDAQLAEPDFQWGKKDGKAFCDLISSAYNEVPHWRRNIFMVPSGKVGKSFVRELATLYQAYADASVLECIALKACTVVQCLLQKPHAKSKAKEYLAHLERRMKLWQDGNIDDLLHEGRCIQKHLVYLRNQTPDSGKTNQIFSCLMLQGKVNAALRLLSQDVNGGVLSLDDPMPMESGQNGEAIQKTTRRSCWKSILKENQHQMSHYWISTQPSYFTTQSFMSR